MGVSRNRTRSVESATPLHPWGCADDWRFDLNIYYINPGGGGGGGAGISEISYNPDQP